MHDLKLYCEGCRKDFKQTDPDLNMKLAPLSNEIKEKWHAYRDNYNNKFNNTKIFEVFYLFSIKILGITPDCIHRKTEVNIKKNTLNYFEIFNQEYSEWVKLELGELPTVDVIRLNNLIHRKRCFVSSCNANAKTYCLQCNNYYCNRHFYRKTTKNCVNCRKKKNINKQSVIIIEQ